MADLKSLSSTSTYTERSQRKWRPTLESAALWRLSEQQAASRYRRPGSIQAGRPVDALQRASQIAEEPGRGPRRDGEPAAPLEGLTAPDLAYRQR